MDNNLRQIGPFLFKCTKCGTEVPSGIVNLSSHWAECSGDKFMKDLHTAAESGALDVPLLKEIVKHHKENEQM